MKNCFVLLLGILLLASCGGDGGEDPKPLPANLVITVDNDQGNGEVTVTATAENTKLYKIYFGDSPNTPVSSETGVATHTYTAEGTYTIKVEAFATVTDMISKTQDVVVSFAPPANLDFTVNINDQGTGEVTVTAIAENTKVYRVNFGDADNTIQETQDGIATFSYGSTGTYTIEVEAESGGGDVISKTKQIDVTVTPKSWQLVWADEFNSTTINTDNWRFEIGNNGGWGNNELQYYQADNTSVQMDGENGYLVIEAKKENKEGFQYTSSRMITKGKQEFLFGRVEIRAKLPKGQGIWPALWMLGANIDQVQWPRCGEIDIMELVGGGAGRDNRVYGTLHWYNDSAPGAVGYASYGGNVTLSSGIFADDYHVFSIEWNKDFIIWFLDGVEFHRTDITPAEAPSRFDEFRKAQFLIFNVAVGGNWPGSPNETTTFPQRMSVDYVRVYQYK